MNAVRFLGLLLGILPQTVLAQKPDPADFATAYHALAEELEDGDPETALAFSADQSLPGPDKTLKPLPPQVVDAIHAAGAVMVSREAQAECSRRLNRLERCPAMERLGMVVETHALRLSGDTLRMPVRIGGFPDPEDDHPSLLFAAHNLTYRFLCEEEICSIIGIDEMQSAEDLFSPGYLDREVDAMLIDEAFFLLAVRSTGSPRQIAFVNRVGLTRESEESLSPARVAAIRRGGATIFADAAMAACTERLEADLDCPWFLGFDVYLTGPAKVAGDTITIPFTIMEVWEKDSCSGLLAETEGGEFTFLVTGRRVSYEGQTVSRWGDTFNWEAIESEVCRSSE